MKKLNAAISRWEEKVRIYERRSGSPLQDGIKASIGILYSVLGALKLKSYVSVKQEVQCYLENRYNEEPARMDINAVGRRQVLEQEG